jgi:hypothetical protein
MVAPKNRIRIRVSYRNETVLPLTKMGNSTAASSPPAAIDEAVLKGSVPTNSTPLLCDAKRRLAGSAERIAGGTVKLVAPAGAMH